MVLSIIWAVTKWAVALCLAEEPAAPYRLDLYEFSSKTGTAVKKVGPTPVRDRLVTKPLPLAKRVDFSPMQSNYRRHPPFGIGTLSQ